MANTLICSLDDVTGNVAELAVYSLPCKQAMIAFIKQSLGNFNTSAYPSKMEGIKNSALFPDNVHFYDADNQRTLYARPLIGTKTYENLIVPSQHKEV